MINKIIDLSLFLFIYLFSLKIYFSLVAIDFHWAHIEKKKKKLILLILYSILILNLSLIFGYYVNIFFILIYVLYMYAYSKSSFYGLGDTYITPLLLFFILYQPNFFYFTNFDSLIFNGTNIPEAFLAILCGLIFFSAGFEKRSSYIWRKNKAVLLFFLNPKFKKISVPLNKFSKKILILLNPIIIYSQLSFIFFLLFLPLKLALIPMFIIFLFLMTLSIFFHYSDLTLPSLIMLLISFHLVIDVDDMFLLGYIFECYNLMSLIEKFILFSFFLSVVSSFAIITISDEVIDKNKFLKFLKKIIRFSSGLIKIRVYNEDHLDNPLVQKFYVKDKNSKKEIFTLYNNNGTPFLKKTFFLPTAYLALSFKILDILLEIDKIGKPSKDNYKLLQGIILFMVKEYELKRRPIIFFLSIYQINIENLINNSKKKNFKDVLKISLLDEDRILIKKLTPKLLTYNTKRSVQQKRYQFN